MIKTKNINYLNKDFNQFKQSLINFAKNYFPETHSDFSESSPGMMFIEMASYVGDVLSFYTDTQIQEVFLNTAQDKRNLLNMAYTLGYRPKLSYASSVEIELFQLIPIQGGSPDLDYALIIPENSVIQSINNIDFILLEKVDFSDINRVEISLFDSDNYLFKVKTKAISASLRETTFTFDEPKKFNTIEISDPKFIQILQIKDTEGNDWYEVPYLAQNTVRKRIINPNSNIDGVSYLLENIETPNRYVTRIKNDNTIEVQFGAGIYSIPDTTLLPDFSSLNLLELDPSNSSDLSNNYNKASIFFSQQYGVSPSNTTLTITYLSGGGIETNVDSNTILKLKDTTGINSINPLFTNTSLQTLRINNPSPAEGGREGDTEEEIRLNISNAFSSQLRAVTKTDYMVKALSMPSEFGSIAKAYVEQNSNIIGGTNPLAVSLYVLTYDLNKKITKSSYVLKNNLKNYLEQYRMLTDSIYIKDAYYINIGVNFDITVNYGVNSEQVLKSCVSRLKQFFNIDRWQINQPIILSEIIYILLQTKGVQSVSKIEITNKTENGYSEYSYDIAGATKDGVIYPSLDPSIFEVRNPDLDILGRVVNF